MNQKISLSVATIICINGMIGSGIFTAPIAIANTVGPAAILSYLFTIIAVWSMALCFAELCQRYPEEGSFYTYIKPWAGHNGGLFFACLYVVGLLIANGLLLQMAALYIHNLLPIMSLNQWGLFTLITLATSLVYGLEIVGIWQYLLVCATVLPILITIVICFLNGSFANFTPFAPYGLPAIFNATKIVIFGFFGFEFSTALFRYIDNPQENVKKALTYSIFIVGILYLLFIAAIIYGIPLVYFANPNATIPEVIGSVFPSCYWITPIMHIAIISAIIGTIHAMLLTLTILSRRLVAIASNNCFESACSFNIRSKESFWIFTISCLVLSAYYIFTDLNIMFAVTAIAIVTAFIASLFTLIITKEKESSILMPLCGITTAGVILFFALKTIIDIL